MQRAGSKADGPSQGTVQPTLFSNLERRDFRWEDMKFLGFLGKIQHHPLYPETSRQPGWSTSTRFLKQKHPLTSRLALVLQLMFPVTSFLVIRCTNPKIQNGRKLDSRGPFYKPWDVVMLECNAGYSLSGSYEIQCGEDGVWDPPVPTCILGKQE